MAKGTYTYDPGRLAEWGSDRMRFELGDTMVEGCSDTSALTDEEIQAAIALYPDSWKRAKLLLLESLCRRFAYEVDTKTGPLWLYMQERAKLWRADYEKLKKEVSMEATCQIPLPALGDGKCGQKSSYFFTGMQQNSSS